MSPTAAQTILLDLFQRSLDGAIHVAGGMGTDDLVWQPGDGANSIGWLIWHVGRMQDAQIAHLAGTEQVWTAQGWDERLDLPYSRNATGYGQTPDEVHAFRVRDGALLTGYYRAVHEDTIRYVEGVSDEGLAEVIDTSWDPPVTRSIRLVSIADDAAQHMGQAGYVKGLIERR
jgi:hypothetical protein